MQSVEVVQEERAMRRREHAPEPPEMRIPIVCRLSARRWVCQ